MDLRGQELGRYHLIERIGRGGMSEVYRARSSDHAADVAVKVLRLDPNDPDNPVFEQRFEREAGIIMDLDHPHILSILDYAKQGDLVYYAMPLIGGGTLANVIRAGVSRPEAVCHWLTQIASALDHAHKLDVIHRDLKPGNILLDYEGNAYLTDFGIALLTNYTSNLTQTGIVIGTPAYMSPEQWRDDPLDGRADVYGLAVVVYLLLTAHTPFEAEAAHSMMYLHLNEDPPTPQVYIPELSDAISQVLLKALAKNPNNRYPSAGEFAADFVRAVEGQPLLADDSPTPPSTRAEPVALELPPPVYAEVPSTASYPIPDHLRQGLTYTKQRHNQRRSLALGIGIIFLFSLFPLGLLARGLLASGTSENLTIPSPTVAVTPNRASEDRPRVLINLGQTTYTAGQVIYLDVQAFDPNGGISHVELRRFGQVLDMEEIDDSFPDHRSVEVTLDFLPPTAGDYRLEIIAYRGELASDSKFIQVQVR